MSMFCCSFQMCLVLRLSRCLLLLVLHGFATFTVKVGKVGRSMSFIWLIRASLLILLVLCVEA